MFDKIEREGVSEMPEYLKKINRSSVVQRVIDRLTEAMLNGNSNQEIRFPQKWNCQNSSESRAIP